MMQARRHLQNYNFQAAAEVSKNIHPVFWKESINAWLLSANPFSVQIKETHAPWKEDTIHYSVHDFCMKVIDLQKKVKTDTANLAWNYFLLGNAYYNISHSGNS